MKKFLVFMTVVLASNLSAEPVVDGILGAQEYSAVQSVLGGKVRVAAQRLVDASLSVVLVANANGWAGVGLGSSSMDKATIFMAFVKDGVPTFSEQRGSGHSHTPLTEGLADEWKAVADGGTLTLEFHIPADKATLWKGKAIPYIVAFSSVDDLRTYHDKRASGTLNIE